MTDPDPDLDIASLPPTVLANALSELMHEHPTAVRYVCDMISRLPPESHARLAELVAIERKEYAKLKELCAGIEAIAMSPIPSKH